MCWINVQTQLPEHGSFVDVWVSKEKRRYCDVVYHVLANPQFLGMDLADVTYWRYPPAPPSEHANAASSN